MPDRDGELLLDTDMLILLCASGQMEAVAHRLGYSLNQIRKLPAAIHQVRKSKRFRDTYGEAVLQMVARQIEPIQDVSAPSNFALLDSLNSLVDPGEAQLICIATSEKCALLRRHSQLLQFAR